VTANARFEVAMASEFPGENLDLVTFFDCLDDRFHETAHLLGCLFIHGKCPFRASHMIRTLEALD
jgi:hypothetical protein